LRAAVYTAALRFGPVKIATWNVNSLRVRLPQVLDWLAHEAPDVLALQETKVADEEFEVEALRAAGYHVAYCGQKSYNGVATLTRIAAADVLGSLPAADGTQKRFLATTVEGVRIVNVYVPNGESVVSAKYPYKLEWLRALAAWLPAELVRYPRLALLGDFNIAPEERDVHNPARWRGKVLFSEPERAAFRALLDTGLLDVFRRFEQPPHSFSWWDYRLSAFTRNWGLRIDHILCSPALAADCRACRIDTTPRRAERPSDHAPVVAEFALPQRPF
jgi:exodeoxyribonuclease-3